MIITNFSLVEGVCNMNRLAYRLIVDKKIQRHVDILKILDSLEHPISLSKLSQMAEVSERTLSTDISTLMKLAPAEVTITLTVKNDVSLSCEPEFSISNFMWKIAENEPIFEILADLFQGRFESVKSYTRRLFLSESTLRKKLRLLKTILREYNLDLSLSPLSLVGDEISIRIFFFSYYRIFTNSPLMLPTEGQVAIHATVVETLKKQAKGSLYSDYRRATDWLFIGEQRMHSGHFVTLPSHFIDQQTRKESYIRFKQVYMSQLKQHFNLSSVSEDEIVFAFLIRLDTIVYRHLDIQQFVMMYEEEIPEAILSPFLDTVFNKFELTKTDDIELFNLLKAFLTNSYLLNQLSPLLQKNSFELNQKIETLHSLTYQICLDLLINSQLFTHLTVSYAHDFAISLTLIITSYLHERNLKQKKVLFSLSGETTYLNYFIMVCNCFLPRNIDILFSFNEQITEEFLTDNGIDVWVHNYYVDKTTTSVTTYQLSSFPNRLEWMKIVALLINIPYESIHNFFEPSLEF